MVNQYNVRVVLGACLLIFGCSKELMISNPDRPIVTPSKLEVRGNSIDFAVKTSVPAGALSPTAVYRLVPRFSYEDDVINLDAIEFAGSKRLQEIDKNYSIPYQTGMEDGKLEILGSFSDSKSGERATYRLPLTTANGVITTALLLDESYVPAYSNLDPYYYEKDTLKLDFEFALGGSEILQNETNIKLKAILDSMMQSDRIILGSRVVGTHSPVGSDDINRRLSESRASQVKDLYNQKLLNHTSNGLDHSGLEFDIEFNSWDIFLEKLEETSLRGGSKDRVANIISSNVDYETIKSKLLELPDISTISREVFPKLQMSRLEITFGRTIRDSGHLRQVVDDILKSKLLNELSPEEILSIAQQEPDAQRRLKIYEMINTQDVTSELLNDWAATYLDSYHLWNQSRGSQHLTKVFELLDQSMELKPSMECYINLGIAHSIGGKNDKAEASFMKVENSVEDDSRVNHSLNVSKGVAQIKYGDYSGAVNSFRKAKSKTSTSAYNLGLAYLLENKSNAALMSLDTALSKGYDSAQLLYTKAITANRANNRNLTVQSLAETFRLNPRYNDFFHRDHEFDNINKVLFPRYADSLKRPVRGFKKLETYLTKEDRE